MDDTPQKRSYSIAATFTVERCLRVEATNVEEAAQLAIKTEFKHWQTFGENTEGDDSNFAGMDAGAQLCLETRLDDGRIEETWLNLAEDIHGDITVAGVEETQIVESFVIPYDITRHRRQWPTPKDIEDEDG